jgi:hypothetical protein
MAHEQQWAGINIQWDGAKIAIKYSDMTVRDLTNLFYAALNEIPWCREAMELAIEKTKFSKMDRKTLIHNIRLLRVAKNLKAHELSTLLNLDYNRITTIETNYKTRIDPQEVKIIADHFKVTPEILMTVEGSITFKTQQDGKEDTSES